MATIILDVDEEFSHTHASASQSECIEGTVKMVYPDFEKVLMSGDSVLVPAGIEHVLKNIGATPARIKCAHQPAAADTDSFR